MWKLRVARCVSKLLGSTICIDMNSMALLRSVGFLGTAMLGAETSTVG